jgi:glycosyltransferase involved in cell wall biosynthesis
LSQKEVSDNYANALVSVGLPVRNGANRIERVVQSVLAQDHENVELVICDNASTDETEEVVRGLAARDSRIVYQRHPVNVGLLNNFIGAMRLANGTFFRWVGDDDWLAPNCISRGLEQFGADDRLILVTNQVEYIGADGLTQTAVYDGTALGSDDAVTRFTEMLRLLTESYLFIDPMYGLFRREVAVHIERRNMLLEDQVFATKLALAGPWAHVREVLLRRNWSYERPSSLARKLGVPPWQARVETLLQCREILAYLNECDLDEKQRGSARRAVVKMYVRRKQATMLRLGHKLLTIARGH